MAYRPFLTVLPPMPKLILASSSVYRQELLRRLSLPFECSSPDIDESPQKDESPTEVCERLSRRKAEAISHDHPHAIVIGSDQVASLGGELMGKPGNRQNAVEQLQNCSGQQVDFYTGLCLQLGDQQQFYLARTQVQFRKLTLEEITNYLTIEKPWDCAGSFKAESLGICLFTALKSDDPTALIGLPLIALSQMLRNWGVNPLHKSEY